MKRKMLLGVGLILVATFVFGSTKMNITAETKPPQPPGIVYLPVY